MAFDEDGVEASTDDLDTTFKEYTLEKATRAIPDRKEAVVSHLDIVAVQTLLCNLPAVRITDIVEFDTATSGNEMLRELWMTPPEDIIEAVHSTL